MSQKRKSNHGHYLVHGQYLFPCQVLDENIIDGAPHSLTQVEPHYAPAHNVMLEDEADDENILILKKPKRNVPFEEDFKSSMPIVTFECGYCSRQFSNIADVYRHTNARAYAKGVHKPACLKRQLEEPEVGDEWPRSKKVRKCDGCKDHITRKVAFILRRLARKTAKSNLDPAMKYKKHQNI